MLLVEASSWCPKCPALLANLPRREWWGGLSDALATKTPPEKFTKSKWGMPKQEMERQVLTRLAAPWKYRIEVSSKVGSAWIPECQCSVFIFVWHIEATPLLGVERSLAGFNFSTFGLGVPL